VPIVTIEKSKHITYDDFGEGIPVVFIHPPGMGRHVFYYQRNLSKDMRVIFPDLSGHGDSSKITSEEVTIEYYSKEIIALIDELKLKKVVLCGYSAGGAIAQYISSHFHDRVGGLILFGGYPAVLNSSLRLEHKLGMYMVNHHKNLLTHILAMSHTKNDKLKKLLITHMNKSQQGVWYKYYEEVLHMNIIEDICKINVPLLWMDGTRSDAINRYNTSFKKRTTDYRIVLFKHVNHQIPTKKWKQVNEEIVQYILKLDTMKENI
jgi:pimeloyl-ACP methyl ester carboxylesterase